MSPLPNSFSAPPESRIVRESTCEDTAKAMRVGKFALLRPVTTSTDGATPASTVTGNPFTIPAGWSASVKGPATIITPPEGGSHIVYVDVEAENAESALAKAWAAYKEPRWPLKLVDEQADDNGWSRRKRFEYQTSPNERRGVVAGAMFANGRWTVWIYDMADEVGGKRRKHGSGRGWSRIRAGASADRRQIPKRISHACIGRRPRRSNSAWSPTSSRAS